MKETANYKLKKIELTDSPPDITVINPNWDTIDEKLHEHEEGKVDKAEGKDLSTNDYTTAEKTKLAGIENEANKYIHPATHPASMIVQDSTRRFVTDTEKSNWNNAVDKGIPYATASGTNTYTVSISGISSLAEGLSVKVKFTNANTGASTLNINGLGAKSIKKGNGNALSSGSIKAGQILHLVYTGTSFQCLGEGGEYGTAQAGDVLAGKTIGTESGLITGTMPNRGAVDNTITTQNGQIVVPAGYHNGSGIVKAQFANLVAENVKSGINIGGVVGSYSGDLEYQYDGQAVKTIYQAIEANGYYIPAPQQKKVRYNGAIKYELIAHPMGSSDNSGTVYLRKNGEVINSVYSQGTDHAESVHGTLDASAGDTLEVDVNPRSTSTSNYLHGELNITIGFNIDPYALIDENHN